MRIDYADRSRAQRRDGLQLHVVLIGAIVALICVFVFGCAGFSKWAGQPIASAPASDAGPTMPPGEGTPSGAGGVEIPLPGGSKLVLPSIPAEPTSYPVKGVGTVTVKPSANAAGFTIEITPTAASANATPTNGDALSAGIGGIAGALLGNPLLGQLAAGVVAAAVGAATKKK